MSVRKHFPENLKRLRKEKGLSQRDLTERLGFSQGYVSRLESGDRDPSLSTLVGLAEVLDTTVIQLLSPPSAESAQGVPSRKELLGAAVNALIDSVEQQSKLIEENRRAYREITGRLDRLSDSVREEREDPGPGSRDGL